MQISGLLCFAWSFLQELYPLIYSCGPALRLAHVSACPSPAPRCLWLPPLPNQAAALLHGHTRPPAAMPQGSAGPSFSWLGYTSSFLSVMLLFSGESSAL